jgi:ATP-dependent helicase/nuclease subunit B
MSIRFILGRAGSGKSRYCLDDIRQKLLESPSGHPLMLLVPEQATFQAEYALVSTPEISGIIRAQALSFRRLAFRTMQETGGTTRTPIDDTGKKMLLYKTLFKRKQELRLFQHTVEQVGFVDGLNDLFNELKRYCITPLEFTEHLRKKGGHVTESSSMLGDKLHDLLMIYDDYEAELSSQYIDAEDYLNILADQLKDSNYIKQSEIWIDGFYGFTPQEFQVIEQLIKYGKNIHITVCIDREYGATERPNELDLFHPTASTLIQLQEMVDKLGISKAETVLLDASVPPRFTDRPMLAHIEQSYHQRRQWRHKMDEDGNEEDVNLSVHAAVNRRAEIEGAAREMLRLVRDCGYRWRDMAVMVRNAVDYQDLLTAAFTDYDIPFFFDQKQPVMHHPLIEFIRSALEVIQFNWRYDSIFRCIKTDFLLPINSSDDSDSRITRHTMDELENYVLAFGIHGYRWFDSKPWGYKRSTSLEDESDQTTEREHIYLQEINHTRQQVVKPLLTFQKKMESAKNVRDRVEALYGLLESVQASKRLEQWSSEAVEHGNPEKSREHTQIWGRIMDTLDQVVEVMGHDDVPLEMFVGLLETGLESIKLGLVPPSLDQVLIGSIDRTRSTQIKYSFILGVNDGIMPAKVKEDGVLSEREREHLIDSGLKMAPGSRRKLLDEQFLIYTALTTPSEHLWLSYPLADEEGKSLLPSEIIRRIRSMFPKLNTRFLMAEPLTIQDQQTQFEYIAHPERALSYLVVQLRQWKRGVEIDPIWWDVYNWVCTQEKWRSKLERMLFGLFYRNQEKSLTAATSKELYGDHLKASVSRMEKYISCPFAQFISHGLRLQERQVYRLEAPDIGQLFHAALSRIAVQLQEENVSWGDLSQQECEQRAALAVDELSPRLQSEILLSSKRYFYIAHKLKKVIGRASVVLGEHARRGAFVPVGLELDFGTNRTLPPLSFSLDNGSSMEIIGRIDRVDRAESDRGVLLRIIDYKSSQTSLALSDVYYGLSLQVLTYLDVVVTHAEQWLGKKAIPAGVLYFHVHHPILQTKNTIPQQQAEDALFKLFKMRGLVLADNEVVQQMDTTLQQGHSEIIPVSVKADGSFYKNSSVVSEGQWDYLRSFVRKTIKGIGTGITNGNVEIRPYRMGQKTPCAFCSYKPICQFDQLYEGNQYNYLKRLPKDEVWEHLERSRKDNT